MAEELQNAKARIAELENEVEESSGTNQKVVSQLRQAQFEVEGLRQENQELQNKLQTLALSNSSIEPDYEAARARTFNLLKVGRQSAAGKAIDAFLKELRRE